MKNLKIGKKLIVTFAIIMALFLASVAVAISCLNTVASNFDYFYNQSHSVVTTQLDMRRAFQSAVKNIIWSTTTLDTTTTKNLIAQAEDDFAVVDAGIAVLLEKYSGDQSLITEFQSKMSASLPFKEEIYEYSRLHNMQGAMKVYRESYSPLLVEAQGFLEQIGDSASAQAAELYLQGDDTEKSATLLLVGSAAVALVFIIILCSYITHSITRPLKEIEAAAKGMSQGNLKAEIGYRSKDEMGSLAESMRVTTSRLEEIITDIGYILGEMGNSNFNARTRVRANYIGDFAPILNAIRGINISLSTTLHKINLTAEEVMQGSEQVSNGSQALSEGASQQASSVEELASAINEISAQVKNNAASATEASRLATDVGGEMGASEKQMVQMVRAMDEINQSSAQIGKIIKTIEDIAFQTNILALNAAVEAARAGSAGKGFAVVADEVRNLASKSAEASKNTSALIQASVLAVKNGTQIADSTAKSLLKAVSGANDVTSTIDKISHASGSQANSIALITQGMDQISSVVQTNSATAQESAAASEELSAQAQSLKAMVAQFTLRPDIPAQPSGAYFPASAREPEPAGKY